jgi:coproporphyrinogen III oxidase
MGATAEQEQKAQHWYLQLQNDICQVFEDIETEVGSSAKFERKQWQREGGGGGEMRIMRGEVFEKVGVNTSTVHGVLPQPLKDQFDIQGLGGDEFWASGISLVAHMKSPIVPSVHMNTRMITTQNYWFGGGMDLTPTVEFAEDTESFHGALKKMCMRHNEDYYAKFKQECDDYFFIKHRNQARGVGGIFYDYLNNDKWERDFLFNQEVGQTFLDVFPALVRSRYRLPWNETEKKQQLVKRALYAEFNLLYDRGTKFGLITGGNPEAILMSLPPVCAWQ